MENNAINIFSLLSDGGLIAFVVFAWWKERRDARTDRIYYRNLAYQLLRVILVVTVTENAKIETILTDLKPTEEPPPTSL